MKLSKVLHRAKVQNRCVRALRELREVEDQLRKSDFKRKVKKEEEAIRKMKENLSYFFLIYKEA